MRLPYDDGGRAAIEKLRVDDDLMFHRALAFLGYAVFLDPRASERGGADSVMPWRVPPRQGPPAPSPSDEERDQLRATLAGLPFVTIRCEQR